MELRLLIYNIYIGLDNISLPTINTHKIKTMEEFEDKKNEEEQQQAVANDSSSTTTETDVIDQSAEAEEVRALQDSIDGTEEEVEVPVDYATASKALTDAATMLDQAMSAPETEALGLTDDEKTRFAAISAAAQSYASQNKAMMAGPNSNAPAKILEHLQDKAACYDMTNDIIYIKKGPESPTDFNSIIHELSHALSKDAPDEQRLMMIQDSINAGNVVSGSTDELIQNIDYNLTLTRVELKAEFDGFAAMYAYNNDEEDGQGVRADSYVKYVEDWRTGKTKDESSRTAYGKWKKIIAALQGQLDSDVFDSVSYKQAGENYINGDLAFPTTESYFKKD